MLDILSSIFIGSAPLLCAAMGALASEYTGALAVFIDGIINLSAFLFFSVSVFSGNPWFGASCSLFFSVLLICLISLFTIKTRANPFLTGLAVNLFSSGLTSLLSFLWFNTRGVAAEYITGTNVFSNKTIVFSRLNLSVILWIFTLLFLIVLRKTHWGLSLQITGTCPQLLKSRHQNPDTYRLQSWALAAFFAGIAGIVYALRIAAFVPNISAGRGWIALAAVFLGKKRSSLTVFAVLAFALAEYGANVLQGLVPIFSNSLFLSLPYIGALLLFIVLPPKK